MRVRMTEHRFICDRCKDFASVSTQAHEDDPDSPKGWGWLRCTVDSDGTFRDRDLCPACTIQACQMAFNAARGAHMTPMEFLKKNVPLIIDRQWGLHREILPAILVVVPGRGEDLAIGVLPGMSWDGPGTRIAKLALAEALLELVRAKAYAFLNESWVSTAPAGTDPTSLPSPRNDPNRLEVVAAHMADREGDRALLQWQIIREAGRQARLKLEEDECVNVGGDLVKLLPPPPMPPPGTVGRMRRSARVLAWANLGPSAACRVEIPEGAKVRVIAGGLDSQWAVEDEALIARLTGNEHDARYRHVWVEAYDVLPLPS